MRHSAEGNCDNFLFYICPMFHISILILSNAGVGSITDSVDVFEKVNAFCKELGEPSPFFIQLVGFSEEVKYNHGKYIIRPEVYFESVHKTDLIIIPAFTGYANSATYLNKDCCTWISNAYKNGAEIAALSTGAFLLAFTGILNGKQCTTHWAYANEFRYFYPAITVVDEKVITDQDGLY